MQLENNDCSDAWAKSPHVVPAAERVYTPGILAKFSRRAQGTEFHYVAVLFYDHCELNLKLPEQFAMREIDK